MTASGPSHGPRFLLELADDDDLYTIEITVSVDEEETGHVVLTMERRPLDWDEGDKAKPVQRVSMDFDGTNAGKIAMGLAQAVEWGREYLS